ncbi:TPA: transposase, partial [Legionella pneumophila subsp. pneumophila]|nr:transposase [Legionella pneumophila subsp. pneumophila]
MYTERSIFKLGKEKSGAIQIGKRGLEQHLLEADIC